MSCDIPLSCRCGDTTGALLDAAPRTGDHIVCHCIDCQDLARLTGHADMLDDHGGSALFQGRCARIRIDAGLGTLRCVHLTDEPTLRWYAGCCETPLFNTYKNGKVPYLATQVAALDPGSRGALGKPRGHLHLRDAQGDTAHLTAMTEAQLMRRFALRALRDLFSGARRRSPLFDSETLEPIVPPRRLSDAEKSRLGRD